jgi:hypothetical protein
MKQLTDYRINGLGKEMCLQGNNTTAVATNATYTTSTSTYTSKNNKKNNNRLVCLYVVGLVHVIHVGDFLID